ncbi:MAG: GHMP kinase [Salinivenus sp.]
MSVTATAPGSITTIFAPRDGEASLGVSFATADGAQVTVAPAAETGVFLDGERASIAPVAGVLRRLGATAEVRVETQVPIGCGFGVSGAATLATALAVNDMAGLGHSRDELVQASHRAEVEAGTGLGDVFIQAQGGLVWDCGEGLQRVPCTEPLGYASFGNIATADVLGDEAAVRTVKRVGENALTDLDPAAGLRPLFEASWAFAKRTGLATERVEQVVSAVRANGGAATMAMVGETVVSVGHADALDETTHTTNAGAQVR